MVMRKVIILKRSRSCFFVFFICCTLKRAQEYVVGDYYDGDGSTMMVVMATVTKMMGCQEFVWMFLYNELFLGSHQRWKVIEG